VSSRTLEAKDLSSRTPSLEKVISYWMHYFQANGNALLDWLLKKVKVIRVLTTLENWGINFLILENSGYFKFTQGIFVSVIMGIDRVLTTLENLENSGNFLILENSGNFNFTHGIFVSVILDIEFCA